MDGRIVQGTMFGEPTPAQAWDDDADRRALDSLFSVVGEYRSSTAFRELIDFVASFRFYSHFNALLVHIQKPGATFVAPASRWFDDFGRRIKPGARPMVILQPMGPVMFVFDLSDTEALPGAPPLPREVENPFEVRKGRLHGGELEHTMHNAVRDGVRVTLRDAGTQSAGAVRTVKEGQTLDYQIMKRAHVELVKVPLRYDLLLNQNHSPEAQYATLTHELGHLYCGHLGTPNPRWWPNRTGVDCNAGEFEAEVVSYLACARLGIETPSDEYLLGYLSQNREIPPISIDCVMKVVGLIDQMGRRALPERKAGA